MGVRPWHGARPSAAQSDLISRPDDHSNPAFCACLASLRMPAYRVSLATLFHALTSGVSIHVHFMAMQQRRGLGDIVNVGCRAYNGVYLTGRRVHADVCFHPEYHLPPFCVCAFPDPASPRCSSSSSLESAWALSRWRGSHVRCHDEEKKIAFIMATGSRRQSFVSRFVGISGSNLACVILKNRCSSAVSLSVARRSAAGATNSARASHIASKLLAANLDAHGILMKSSLRCAVSLICSGGQSTSTAPNSTSCCRNVAIRPQQSASSTACWPPVLTRHEGLSPISFAATRQPRPTSPNWRTSSMCSSRLRPG
ncbi:hypothetical protein OKW34_000309 [Paraburkholderia youngii]